MQLRHLCVGLLLAFGVGALALLASDAKPGHAKSWKTYDLRTPIVTNAEQAVDAIVGPVAAKVYNVSAYDGATHTYTNKNGVEKQDYRVVIGAGTVSDGDDGTHGQSVVVGRDAKSHGCASCALGPNSETGDDGFDIAIGWRSVAVSQGAIAIGCGIKSGQDYWLDPERTQHNPNEQATAAVGTNAISIGRGTRAEKNNSMAFGYQAKADAVGAVQLGAGSNTEENTLKFQNTTIVKDGKVVGGFDPASLDPQIVEIDDSGIVTAKTHSVTTIECQTNQTASTYPEIEVYPSGSRNFELFIDNTLANRQNLPLWISDDGAKLFIKTDGMYGPYYKLPVSIKCKEPKPGRCIVETEWIDDGYTWNPTITNVACTMASGESIDDNHVIVVSEVLGTELHFLTNWQVEARYIGGEEDSGNIITNKLNTSIPLYNRVIFDTNSLELDELPTELILVGEGEGFKRIWVLD